MKELTKIINKLYRDMEMIKDYIEHITKYCGRFFPPGFNKAVQELKKHQELISTMSEEKEESEKEEEELPEEPMPVKKPKKSRPSEGAAASQEEPTLIKKPRKSYSKADSKKVSMVVFVG